MTRLLVFIHSLKTNDGAYLMQNQDHQSSVTPLGRVFGVAKKFSHYGLQRLNALDQQKKVQPISADTRAIEGQAKDVTAVNMQNIVRQHLPNISQQLLGRHFSSISQVVGFLSPIRLEEAADYLFEQLNRYAEQLSQIEKILEEAGVANLNDLVADVSRSDRISQALIEQNKWLAAFQGGLSGLLGGIGAAIDIPLSVLLVLKTVYQTGRSYGFELKEDEKDSIEFIFQQIQMNKIAEKQTVLLAIHSFLSLLKANDIQQLQQFLGSNNDLSWLNHLLHTDDNKDWHGTMQLSLLSRLTKVTPIVLTAVSATYGYQLIQDTGKQAQHVFSIARDYLLCHPEQKITILQAYEKAIAQAALIDTKV